MREQDIAQVLPSGARQILIRAYAEAVAETNELRREVIIESAVLRVKMQYPSFFR